jgi:putative glutamine amidotransferase
LLRPFVIQHKPNLAEVILNAPLVGITTTRNRNDVGFPQHSLSQAYLTALIKAGATPVMIPLGLDNERIEVLSKRLDGIIFSGGGDIHPGQYHGDMHDAVKYVDTDRDRVEIQFVHTAIENRLPFFGICRGLQVINVALGGTLFEDILDQRPNSLKHQYYPDYPREYLAHEVELVPDSQIYNIFETNHIEVNSLHHQGIDRLAPGMQATAFAPDGLIEAIEINDYPFGLAVQWHPENLQAILQFRALFSAFVQVCQKKTNV